MRSVEALIPEPAAGLAHGLVLGVKRALGDELERSFRIAGIIHIVVLSGYNITIVVEATMRLLSYFFRPRTRVVFGALAIVAFALIAGLSSTVIRASFMAVLVLVARATGRTYDVLRALVFAGLVMLLVNPKLLVYDPGFQLSFLATLGLILLAPLIEERLSLVPTRFQIREFITATVATQIFVLPLLLYSIGEFSLVAVLVNVLVLPVVPFAMLFVFLSGMLGFVSSLIALPFAYIAYLLLGYIIAMAEWFAALPFAALIVPTFPFWITIIAYAVMAYAMYRISTMQQIEAKQNNF
jgi:competence protein ComEC